MNQKVGGVNGPNEFYSISTYYWPCDAGCDNETFAEAKCASWTDYTSSCNMSTGLPWVEQDGFIRPYGNQDQECFVRMTEAVAPLSLAYYLLEEDSYG